MAARLTDQEKRLRAVTEKQLTSDLLELVKVFGWHRYHTYRSERSPAGFPDEVLARERVIYVELKTMLGKLAPLQEEWLQWLRAAGQEVYVWRPSDRQEMAEVLARRVR